MDSSNAQGVIRATGFLEDYRTWERYYQHPPQGAEARREEKVRPFPSLNALRDKESWAFEEADKVRELCRHGKIERDELESRIYESLSAEMERASAEKGLQEHWAFYDSGKDWLAGWERSEVRRAINRRSSVAMFRELCQIPSTISGCSRNLQQFGFDFGTVQKGILTVRKFLRAEQKKQWKESWKSAGESVQREFFEKPTDPADSIRSGAGYFVSRLW